MWNVKENLAQMERKHFVSLWNASWDICFGNYTEKKHEIPK